MTKGIRITWEEAAKQFEYAVSVNGAPHIQSDSKGMKGKWMIVVGLDHGSRSLVCKRWDDRYMSMHARDTGLVMLKPEEIDNWRCYWFSEAVKAREKYDAKR